MQTLLLDRTTWDLVVDLYGNIAVASNPYSLAQDAASATRTFSGEVWYDTTLGVPYFQQVLGQPISPQYLRTQLVEAAMTVPEVVFARCFFSGLVNRQLTGQIQVSDVSGTILAASF